MAVFHSRPRETFLDSGTSYDRRKLLNLTSRYESIINENEKTRLTNEIAIIEDEMTRLKHEKLMWEAVKNFGNGLKGFKPLG